MLPTTTRKKQYAIAYPFNTLFTFDFKFWDATQISAILSFDDGTNDLTLAPTVDFSLTAPADSGILTRLTDWNHAAKRITILRTVDLTQDTDYRNGEAVDMDLELEKDFDLTVARAQQQQEQLDRMVVYPVTDPPAAPTLPALGVRKGTILAFNDVTGDPVPAVGALSVPVSDYMRMFLLDTTADEVKGDLGMSAYAGQLLAAADSEAAKAILNDQMIQATVGDAVAPGDIVVRKFNGTTLKKAAALTYFQSLDTAINLPTASCHIVFLTETTAVLVLSYAGSGYPKCYVVTYDEDGVPTIGAAYMPDAGNFGEYEQAVIRITDTKFYLAYGDGAGASLWSIVGTVTGSTISFGAKSASVSAETPAAGHKKAILVKDTVPYRVMLNYMDGSQFVSFVLQDIDGTDNITNGTPQLVYNGAAAAPSYAGLLDDTAAIIFYVITASKQIAYKVCSWTNITTLSAGTQRLYATAVASAPVMKGTLTLPGFAGVLLFYSMPDEMEAGQYRLARFMRHPAKSIPVREAIATGLGTLFESVLDGQFGTPGMGKDGSIHVSVMDLTNYRPACFHAESDPPRILGVIDGLAQQVSSATHTFLMAGLDRDRASMTYVQQSNGHVMVHSGQYRHRVLGFAVQNKTAGQPVLIRTGGNLKAFAGLIPGTDYYLRADGTMGTSGLQKVGRAMAADTLKIQLQ